MNPLDPTKLNNWAVIRTDYEGFCVIVQSREGKKTIIPIEEELAHIIAAAPLMLSFLHSLTSRGPGVALYVDIQRLFQVAKLNIIPHPGNESLPDLREAQNVVDSTSN